MLAICLNIAGHGIMPLDEALDLPLDRLAIWAAYLKRREDVECFRVGMIAATVANFAGKQATRHITPADIFQRLKAIQAPKRELSHEEFQAMMSRWMRPRRK